MKWTSISAVAVALVVIGNTRADAGYPWSLFGKGCRSCPRLGCCDDYCPKPLPCVRPNCRGCVDDYCGKTLPCVPCNWRGCVDDYCPKPCPRYLPPLCGHWYSCGTQERCYSGCHSSPACDSSSHWLFGRKR